MKNKKTLIFLIIVNVLWAVSFLPSLTSCGMSVMLFDAPGSESSTFTIMLFISVLSYPPAVVIAVAGSMVMYLFKKEKLSIVFALLPLLSLFMVALSLGLITVFCNGSLVCP